MKKVIFILALALTGSMTFAQDTPLEISGSADLYYKYDFSKFHRQQSFSNFLSQYSSPMLHFLNLLFK